MPAIRVVSADAGRRVRAALVAIVLTGCGVSGYGPIDSDVPNFVPPAGVGGPEIRTTTPDGAMFPGVEGSVLFVRLVKPDGETILDRPFAWPSDRQRVPAGTYMMSAYFRTCVGNCGNLDVEGGAFCEEDLVLGPSVTVEIHVMPEQPCAMDDVPYHERLPRCRCCAQQAASATDGIRTDRGPRLRGAVARGPSCGEAGALSLGGR